MGREWGGGRAICHAVHAWHGAVKALEVGRAAVARGAVPVGEARARPRRGVAGAVARAGRVGATALWYGRGWGSKEREWKGLNGPDITSRHIISTQTNNSNF